MLGKIVKAFIITALFVSFRGHALEPEIRQYLNKDEISIGEKTTLTVEMEWKDEETALIITQITPPSSGLLNLLDTKQITSSILTKDGAFAKTVLEYVYTGKEKGSSDITPAVIEYTLSDNPENVRIVRAQPVQVKVISQAAGFMKTALKSVWAIFLMAVFFGMFALFKKILVSFRINKKKETGGNDACLEKKFCEDLRNLNEHKVSGDIGAYYSGIEKLIFGYVKDKYDTGAPAETKGRVPPELQRICDECKFISEKVRFSGYKPQGAEQEKLMRAIHKYMKPLMPNENEEETIKTINKKGGYNGAR